MLHQSGHANSRTSSRPTARDASPKSGVPLDQVCQGRGPQGSSDTIAAPTSNFDHVEVPDRSLDQEYKTSTGKRIAMGLDKWGRHPDCSKQPRMGPQGVRAFAFS